MTEEEDRKVPFAVGIDQGMQSLTEAVPSLFRLKWELPPPWTLLSEELCGDGERAWVG